MRFFDRLTVLILERDVVCKQKKTQIKLHFELNLTNVCKLDIGLLSHWAFWEHVWPLRMFNPSLSSPYGKTRICQSFWLWLHQTWENSKYPSKMTTSNHSIGVQSKFPNGGVNMAVVLPVFNRALRFDTRVWPDGQRASKSDLSRGAQRATNNLPARVTARVNIRSDTLFLNLSMDFSINIAQCLLLDVYKLYLYS